MVECLSCGQLRDAPGVECPRCGYVGWAMASDLDERVRQILRERSVERRRIRLVA